MYTVKFRFTTGPIIGPSANYDYVNPPPANYTVLRHQLNPFTILVSRGANKSRCEPDNI